MSDRRLVAVTFCISAALVGFGLASRARLEQIRAERHRALIECEVRRDSSFLCDKLRQELLAVSLPPPS